ncbi:MAG: hypothetical protein D4R74_03390 [Betaproteobacteria bacterium]|nr:MAG: hypothetical protein D4R74_03390 [Betaproteobacteria bacterium]
MRADSGFDGRLRVGGGAVEFQPQLALNLPGRPVGCRGGNDDAGGEDSKRNPGVAGNVYPAWRRSGSGLKGVVGLMFRNASLQAASVPRRKCNLAQRSLL